MMKNIIILCVGFLAGMACCNLSEHRPAVLPGRTTVLTRVDTVRVTRPEIVVVRAAGEFTERFEVADSAGRTDSADVRVPCAQAVYAGDGYRAYVSGYRPKLDSIILHRPTVERIQTVAVRQRRLGIALQAGYGFTPKGLQPYVGVGISWRIL